MPTPIDISAVPVRVVIYNTNGSPLDCSAAFLSLEVGAGDWEPSGWWRPTGTLRLAANAGVEENFDPRSNPTRWAPGNRVEISVDVGAGFQLLPFALRIINWPARPGRGSQRLEIEVGTDPDLLSYRSPEGDAGGTDYGSPTALTALAAAAINAADTAAILTLQGAPALSVLLPYSPGKNSGGPWIDFAGEMMYAANGILWQRSDGIIRVEPFSLPTFQGLAAIAHYTAESTAARYEPQAPTETPPQIIRVTGTGATLTPATDSTETTSVTEDGATITTTVQYINQGTRTPAQRTTVTKPRNLVLPDYDSTNITTDTVTYIEWTYDQNDGKLLSIFTQERGPFGRIEADVPPLNEGVAFNVVTLQETLVQLIYDLNEPIIRRRVTSISRPTRNNIGITSFNVVQRVRERWNENNGRYTYSRNVTNFGPRNDTNAPRMSLATGGNVRPPATEYQPPAFTREGVDYAATINVTSPTGGGYLGKRQQISLPGGLAASNSQCASVGQTWAAIRHGRQWPIAWTAPLTAAWLTGFSPVCRVDFTAGGIRTAYLVAAWSLVLNQRTARVGGTTIELGTVAADGSGTPVPPYTIT